MFLHQYTVTENTRDETAGTTTCIQKGITTFLTMYLLRYNSEHIVVHRRWGRHSGEVSYPHVIHENTDVPKELRF